MRLGDENPFFTLNPGINIINLDNSSNQFDTDYSYHHIDITLTSKMQNLKDQEKGFDKEAFNKNESALLIDENISKSNNINIKNFEIEKKSINIGLKLKHYGNTIPLYFNKEGDPLIVIGPHCNINYN